MAVTQVTPHNTAGGNVNDYFGKVAQSNKNAGVAGKETSRTELDQSGFMKIMIEQIKAQDPTKPQDSQDMLDSLSKFSQLDSAKRQEDYLKQIVDSLGQKSKFDSLSSAAQMVGHNVAYDTSTIDVKKGHPDRQVRFNVEADAPNVTVRIVNKDNTLIKEFNLGAKAGDNEFAWDGTNLAGSQVGDGTYKVQVLAKDASNQTVKSSLSGVLKVASVGTDSSGNVVLDSGDGRSIVSSDIVGVKNDDESDNKAIIDGLKALNNNMVTSSNRNEMLSGAALLGKNVRYLRSEFDATGGSSEDINFMLPKDVPAAKITFYNEAGNVVYEEDLANLQKGDNSFTWDVQDASGNNLPAGKFSVSIKGKDADGHDVDALPYGEDSIKSTNFVVGGGDFGLDNGETIKREDLIRVL